MEEATTKAATKQQEAYDALRKQQQEEKEKEKASLTSQQIRQALDQTKLFCEKYDSLEEERDEARTENEQLKQQLNRYRTEQDEARAEIAALEKSNDDKDRKIAALERQLAAASTS